MLHHQTLKPLLLSLIKGAKVTKSEDEQLIKFIHSLRKQEIDNIGDRLVIYLRQELKVTLTDRMIEQTARAMGGNTQTAYEENSDC